MTRAVMWRTQDERSFQLRPDRLELAETGATLDAAASALLAGFRITSDELALIRGLQARRGAEPRLDLAGLSAIYRVVVLARALQVRISALDLLLRLTPPDANPFEPGNPDATRRFVDIVREVQASDFTPGAARLLVPARVGGAARPGAAAGAGGSRPRLDQAGADRRIRRNHASRRSHGRSPASEDGGAVRSRAARSGHRSARSSYRGSARQAPRILRSPSRAPVPRSRCGRGPPVRPWCRECSLTGRRRTDCCRTDCCRTARCRTDPGSADSARTAFGRTASRPADSSPMRSAVA